jgi:NAD(P)-dependent dehydrogenase (short-subunit alcohol dehydrogenase family)
MRLDGIRALIAGAASGVGSATARVFAHEGADLVLADPDSEAVATLAGETGAVSYTASLADDTQIARLAAEVAERWDRLDVLINHSYVHISGPAPVEEISDQAWQEALDLYLMSPIRYTRHFLPLLKRSSAASIVYWGSVDGLLGNPGVPAYSAAKGALVPVTHIAAQQFGGDNIRANLIAFAGLRLSSEEFGVQLSPEVMQPLLSVTPLGRIGEPDEFAQVALFLASRESSYVTGSTIIVDGGRIGITPGTYRFAG